jgi:hypothetical protein|tara:strand:+ start:677 stop:853 length:177 start_codon:yes stop_codon:yes gene_type:complete
LFGDALMELVGGPHPHCRRAARRWSFAPRLPVSGLWAELGVVKMMLMGKNFLFLMDEH